MSLLLDADIMEFYSSTGNRATSLKVIVLLVQSSFVPPTRKHLYSCTEVI
jgi:hypothetical protein